MDQTRIVPNWGELERGAGSPLVPTTAPATNIADSRPLGPLAVDDPV